MLKDLKIRTKMLLSYAVIIINGHMVISRPGRRMRKDILGNSVRFC